MMTNGTFATVLNAMAEAMAPLSDELAAPDGALELLAELGVITDVVPAALADIGPLATDVIERASSLDRASGDGLEILTEALALSAALGRLSVALVELGPALAAELPSQPPEVDTAAIGRNLLDRLVVDYLAARAKALHAVLATLGIVKSGLEPVIGADQLATPADDGEGPEEDNFTGLEEAVDESVANPPLVLRRALLADQATLLFQDLGTVLTDVFAWGSEDFQAGAIQLHLLRLFRSLGVDAAMYTVIESAASSEDEDVVRRSLKVPLATAFSESGLVETAAELNPLIDANDGGSDAGLTLGLFLEGAAEHALLLSEGLSLTAKLSTALSAPLLLTVRPPFDVEAVVDPDKDASPTSINGELVLHWAPKGGLSLLAHDGLVSLRADALELGFGLNESGSGAEPTASFRLVAGQLEIGMDQGDAFLEELLGSGFSAEFDLGASWSSEVGFHFDGSGDMEVTIVVGASLGPLRIDSLTVVISVDSDGAGLELRVTGSFTLGLFALSADGLGVGATLVVTEQGGNLGLFQMAPPYFVPPRGLSIALDISDAVSGGGYLYLDPDAGSYDGVLDLELLNVGISAVAIIDTKLPDVDGWSMFFGLFLDLPSIQLGFGFTLLGVGGVAGVNRAIDVDALGSAVRSGSLDTILFPEDPIADAPIIIDAFRSIFPAANDSYVFGPIVKIGWGTPPLIEAELGIVIQLPDPIVIVVLGSLSAILPRKDTELVALNLDVAGVIDFDAGTLSIDASLHNSHVVGFALSGDMALRAEFGNAQAFLMSVGGFHPRFDPPGDFPDLRRLSFGISAGSVLRIDFQSYFALTSNSVQCGASFVLDADVVGFGVYGASGFDALVQFSPFVVLTSVDFEVSIKAAGIDLIGVMLHASVEGPNRWHVIGTARFEVLGLGKDIRVDELIGPKENEPPVEAPNLLEDLVATLESDDAWQVVAGNDAAVTLIDITDPTAGLLATPDSLIEVRQTLVPLGVDLEQFGNAPIGAHALFDLASKNGDKITWLDDWFTPAQYFELSKADKLEGPEFEQMRSGLQFGGGAPAEVTSVAVDTGYQAFILDPELPEADTSSRFTAVLHAEAGAPLTARTGSGFTALHTETVATTESAYVLVDEAGTTVMQSSTWSAAHAAASGRTDLHIERLLTEVGS